MTFQLPSSAQLLVVGTRGWGTCSGHPLTAAKVLPCRRPLNGRHADDGASHLILSHKNRFAYMTTSRRRRLRGTAMDNVQLNTLVPQEDKDFFFGLANRMGVSTGEAMERLIAQLRREIQPDGLPTWFDRSQLPEALPMAKAG